MLVNFNVWLCVCVCVCVGVCLSVCLCVCVCVSLCFFVAPVSCVWFLFFFLQCSWFCVHASTLVFLYFTMGVCLCNVKSSYMTVMRTSWREMREHSFVVCASMSPCAFSFFWLITGWMTAGAWRLPIRCAAYGLLGVCFVWFWHHVTHSRYEYLTWFILFRYLFMLYTLLCNKDSFCVCTIDGYQYGFSSWAHLRPGYVR
jgi:hypothetical protein